MKHWIQENKVVFGTGILVVVIAVLCGIFRYDYRADGYYEVQEKKMGNLAGYLTILDDGEPITLKCSKEDYANVDCDSNTKYHIEYQNLRFGNGTGKLISIDTNDTEAN